MLARITPLTLAAALLLAGCANPILRVDAPGYSPEVSKAPSTEPRSMDEALLKLNHFRAAYYEAIRSQVGQAQDATTGLVWLGTAIAGLAVAKVHRDAFLGTTLIGSTTYGLVRTQVDARRLDVWTNGLEALDCAREASLPIDIDPRRQAELEKARAALVQQRLATQGAVQAVRDAIAPLAAFPDKVTPAREVVTKGEAALAEADRTQAAALGLLEAARGRELSAAVDRVHTGVTKAMKDIAVDPKSIKPLIAGLGGFSEIFAPNSGIESALGSAFEKFKNGLTAAGAQSVVDLGRLTAAVGTLEEQTRLLAQAQERTRALLKDVDMAQVTAALKKCGVAGIVTALTLEPATLAFTGAGTKGFEIKGGTSPYQVKPLGALPDGLTPVFAGGLADTVDVKLAAGVPEGEYRLRVTDSSPTTRSQQLLVTVGPATGGEKKVVTTPGTTIANAEADWNALLAAIKRPGFGFKIGPSTFMVSEAARAGNGLQVKLSCSPVPNQKLGLPVVRERLAAAEPNATQRLQQAGALDANTTQLAVSGDCLAS